MKPLACAALLLTACSGGSGPDISEEPVIALDRNPIDVSAYVGTVSPVSLQILNQGRGTLTVSSVKLVALDGGALAALDAGGVFDQPLVAVDGGAAAVPPAVQIAGLQTGFVQFNYEPQSAGAAQALLVIVSDAPDSGTLTAAVNACAAAADGGACD